MSLKKELSFLDVFCLAAGAMISSGIFILPGIAFNHAGPGVILSYFLAGVLATSGTLSVVELMTALPKAGGDYFVVSTSFGPLVGTISGLFSWLAISLKTAFAIFGIAELLYVFFGTPVFFSGLFLCLFFTFLNIRGTKEVTSIEVVLVLGLFSLLALFIFSGSQHINPSHYSPFITKGWNVVISTAGLIFVSFGGLLNISSIAEEIKSPKKNIPLAMLSAVCCITIIYTLILIVTVGIIPAEKLSRSLTPIADCAEVSLGSFGFYAITLASLLAFITTAIAGLLSASRYLVGLGRDKLLPAFVARTHKKYNTPHRALIITGLLIAGALLLDVKHLAQIASTVVIVAFILSNISLIIFREAKLRNYRPSFCMPFYPVLPIVNIILFIFLIIDMGITSTEVGIVFVVVGILFYVFYGRHNSSREFALVHVLERIIDKKLTDDSLEIELRTIVHERDDVTYDRFDQLIHDAKILDLEETQTKEKLFELLANEASTLVNTDKETIQTLFLEREKESTTAISSFVAIPHIIIEGNNIFKLVVARCKEGVYFSESSPQVKAIFMLLGTRDERTFHLQALAAIAQIVHDENFEKKWTEAENTAHIRDNILLSKRQRH